MTEKECLICLEQFSRVPDLRCGHFICPHCYCKLKANRPDKKSNKCGCPYCFKNMIRKLRL